MTPPTRTTHDSRCYCGNLLARLRQEGVELKCRRCKRVIVIPWGASTTWRRINVVQWQEATHERVHLTSDDHYEKKQPRDQM